MKNNTEVRQPSQRMKDLTLNALTQFGEALLMLTEVMWLAWAITARLCSRGWSFFSKSAGKSK